MTFVLKLKRTSQQPWRSYAVNKCGWCGEAFLTAAQLVDHVVKERERCGNSAT